MLVLIRVDAGEAIQHTLERPQPSQRAVVHLQDVDPERLRDEEQSE